MKAMPLKPDRNFKIVTSMLPREHTDLMVRIKSPDLKAEFLIFPNRIVFSYPVALALPKGTGRAVKERLKRDLNKIDVAYEPRYTLESFLNCKYANDLMAADLEKDEKVDENYINHVNILWYLGHRCKECGGYRTDVGFDADGNIVYQSLECGHFLFDTAQAESAIGWVTNLMGGEIE